MPRKLDLTGKQFGRWIVLSEGGRKACGAVLWRCRCDCGLERVVRGTSLKTGESASCGCASASAAVARQTTHGGSKSALYKRWRSMLARCEDPNNGAFANYGGRGIVVCERWHSFSNFRADMGEPKAGESLDRIDNNGPYTPENCRWATRSQQNRNQRDNHVVTHNGQTKTVQDWAEELGLKPNTLIYRLRRGWTLEQALAPIVHRSASGSRDGGRFRLLRIANQ